ncbi:MAG TPA: RNase adapter RapZ [Rhodospirillaceae bacterium]|nr:RNase adapter RapZ [Rhodospirillaceae bacterium]
MSDPKASSPIRPVVLVTGMSGAGLSTALKVFEDLGYEAVDNLRLGLVEELVDVATDARALAVAIDTRNANFSVPDLLALYQKFLPREDIAPRLIFLECSDESLQQRFTETRRRHPLAFDRTVADGIKREREMLWSVHDIADKVIDTSNFSVHDLRRLISGNFELDLASSLSVFVTSFAYRHGLPREADLVFDVRFLANPHWDKTLRSFSGRDPEVAAFIKKDASYQGFMDNLQGLILPLLPRYQQEGKSYLTIAIGCSGGRHRSVFIAEEITAFLAGNGYIVGLGHRDMDRLGKKA